MPAAAARPGPSAFAAGAVVLFSCECTPSVRGRLPPIGSYVGGYVFWVVTDCRLNLAKNGAATSPPPSPKGGDFYAKDLGSLTLFH